MEKSWNFQKSFCATRILSKSITFCGPLLELYCQTFIVLLCCYKGEDTTVRCFINVKISHKFVLRWSWKNVERVMENHGKIMEFDSGKPLGTLVCVCNTVTSSEYCVMARMTVAPMTEINRPGPPLRGQSRALPWGLIKGGPRVDESPRYL